MLGVVLISQSVNQNLKCWIDQRVEETHRLVINGNGKAQQEGLHIANNFV